MTKIENTIDQITADDVQFLTETECRDVLGVLAMRQDILSDREVAILEACEDQVYELEFGDQSDYWNDVASDTEADANALASAGWGTDEDYGGGMEQW